MINYPFTIRPLSREEGGGYLAESIDLNGCMADGETIAEAVHNLEDAMISWIKTAKELGTPIPSPAYNDQYSGKWVIRTPKSLHRRLAELSKQEGVSLNTLAISLLSQGIGQSIQRKH
jgi:antitoxin HicB